MKKETLEEAAESVYNEFPLRSESLNELAKENFIKGAKWQADRMYSEEEVLELLCKREWCYEHTIPFISVDDWFEQNKKK
jgi:hypothetical protein